MKIHALLLSLLLVIPFTGCTDKYDDSDVDYCLESVYTLGAYSGDRFLTHYEENVMEGTESYSGDEFEYFSFDYSVPVRHDHCDGWQNSTTLSSGDYQIVHSSHIYDTKTITLSFTTDNDFHDSPSSGSKFGINIYSLTQSNLDKYIECEPFTPIQDFTYKNFSSFGTNPHEFEWFDEGWEPRHKSGRYHTFPSQRMLSGDEQSLDDFVVHDPFVSSSGTVWDEIKHAPSYHHFDSYEEKIYIILDNWHCEEPPGTSDHPVGNIGVDYNFGIAGYADCLAYEGSDRCSRSTHY